MSTEVILRCNFCGISNNDVEIIEIGFMGKEEDFHVCDKCNSVISNILYEVSKITIRNPEGYSYNGQKGLIAIINELTE